jgi:hypothetical protein
MTGQPERKGGGGTMAYGHAERNLACIRQLEADLARQLELRARTGLATGLAEPVELTGTREPASQESPEIDESVASWAIATSREPVRASTVQLDPRAATPEC